jgi:hypothetical protein
METINEKTNPTSDFHIQTTMVMLQTNPISKSKTLKTANTSVKQGQIAQERPKQTHRTKRMSENTNQISSTCKSGNPKLAWVIPKSPSRKIIKLKKP